MSPEKPTYAFPPFAPLDPIHIPPVFIPPGEPPCPPDNPECPPEKPPVDVPEPGVVILLLTGILVYRMLRGRRTI